MTRGGRLSRWAPAAALLAACALLAPACPSSSNRPRPLADGERFERELRDDSLHVYRIELPADRLLRVTAHQRGVDLYLRLVGPDGAESTTVDRPIGAEGYEELLVVGAGAHRLEVRPWVEHQAVAPRGVPLGRYEIVAEGGPVEAATPARLAAERACEEAHRYAESTVEVERRRVFERFRDCADGLAAVGDRRRQARAHADLAQTLRTWGWWSDLQLEHLRRAAELYAALGDEGRALESELWQPRTLADDDRRGEAIAALEDLLPRLEDERYPELLAQALGMLGELLSEVGRLDEAFDVLRTASELKVEPSCEQVNRLAQWAYTYRLIGAYRRARDRLDEAIEMGEAEGCDAAQRSVFVYRRGELAFARGELDAAARDAEEAVRLAGRRYRALSRLFQGQVAVANGRLELAAEALAEARRLYAQREDRRAVAICDLGLGDLALERGESEAAREAYRRVLVYVESGDSARSQRDVESYALFGIARSLLAAGEHAAALASVERGLEVVEGMRRERAGPTARAKVVASQRSRYDLHVEVLMRLHEAEPGRGRDAEAVHACERARARSLLDTLSGGLGELSDEARRLRAEIDRLQDRLWDADGAAAAALRRQLDELGLALERERARARPAVAPAQVLGAGEIRRSIDDGSLLLSFHLGEEGSFLWVVDRRGIESHRLPPRAEIEPLALAAYDGVVAGAASLGFRRQRAEKALRELSAVLLAPAAARLGGGERLLIVAEGKLRYVPFAALPLPAAGEGAGEGGEERRLIERHEIVVLPSASALAVQRRRLAGRRPAAGTLVAVADPVFRADDERLSGLPQPPRSRRRSQDLDRLPYTAVEVERILELAPQPTDVLRGFDASAEAVREGRLSDYRYVHLATHAVISGDDPRLVLSLYDAEGQPRQGWLHGRDVYDLDLPAELVVLSACSTALGEEIDGEGLVGFTQGFFAAGAARVMVSLWEVGDESTAELMERFYAGLFARGLSPAAALREAQRGMSRHERWHAPYHWAGFQLQGEPR